LKTQAADQRFSESKENGYMAIIIFYYVT